MRVVGVALIALVLIAGYAAAEGRCALYGRRRTKSDENRALILCVVVVVVVCPELEADKPRKSKSHKNKNKKTKAVDLTKPARRCSADHVEVANNLCCPKDHPVLIDGSCFAHCPEGTDDMVLGAWVGCRDMCEGGYATSINECTNGILSHERKEHAREGVAPKAQTAMADLPSTTVSECPKGYVRVKRQGTGKFKHGGCCPSDHPKLIFGRCYGGCEAGRDELTLGRLVACRAHCPDGWVEHNNDCTKDHEEPKERGDFPREGLRPVDRIVIPKPTPSEDPNAGCGTGYVRASNHYCCPARYPLLKGLLCYAKCKTGYEEADFGCRKACPVGWSQSTLQCAKGARTKPLPNFIMTEFTLLLTDTNPNRNTKAIAIGMATVSVSISSSISTPRRQINKSTHQQTNITLKQQRTTASVGSCRPVTSGRRFLLL